MANVKSRTVYKKIIVQGNSFVRNFFFIFLILVATVPVFCGEDILIPIAFPDYKVTLPSGPQSELGHSGILFIRGSDGLTKYYEYGRYDPPENLGLVRSKSVSNIKFESNKRPTTISLKKVLREISERAGNKGRISAAYIVADGKYKTVLDYLEKRFSMNNNPDRKKYALFTNNCMHFVKSSLEVAGLELPSMIDPAPGSYIKELRSKFENLDYDYMQDEMVFSP
jgi:hypothetical protein